VVRGHPRSSETSPFDRSHMTSYSAVGGDPVFAVIFGVRKLESRGYRVALLV